MACVFPMKPVPIMPTPISGIRRDSGWHDKCFAKAFESEIVVAGGPGLKPYCAAITHLGEGFGDRGKVDLAGARLVAARNICDLNLADEGQRLPTQIDQVAFANLRVVEVEHQPQRRAVDGSD